MRRTSDQAKLLFLGLLRTVSALASTEHKVVPYAAHAAASMPPAAFPDITLRLARRRDVPSIQRCNLATLPENYNQQFYANHLRQWPELVLVAESSEPLTKEQQPIYNPFPGTGPETNVVAYVIGKVEEVAHMVPESNDPDYYYSGRGVGRTPPAFRTEKLGHVTSLAVLDGFRRKGLAQALMHQLHYHMENCYGVESVGLHVRVSNAPAAKLYNAFGYKVAEVIPSYYQDGEDAYLMKKVLTSWDQQQQQQLTQEQIDQRNHRSLFGNLRRAKPWESGDPELLLPRIVGQPQADSSEEEPKSPELLSGAM